MQSAWKHSCRDHYIAAPSSWARTSNVSRLARAHGPRICRYAWASPCKPLQAHAAAACAARPTAEERREFITGNLKQMLKFMGPALVIPLADPIMSLIDTMCIGRFAGTAELAAMGPTGTVFSFAQYVFQSLQIATLRLVASHVRAGQADEAEQLLSTSLITAFTCGLATTLLLETFPQAVIAATGARDPAVIPLSTAYLRIRALAQPAVLGCMVAQSSMLAQQDSITPMITVLGSSLISLVGNLVCVAWLGGGLSGAAATTVATQWANLACLMWALHSGRSKLRPRWGLPSARHLATLATTMGPLSLTYLCKNVSYMIIQTTAATLQTLSIAAHQAVFSLWNLAAWSFTPIEQATLAYIPAAIHHWQVQDTARLAVAMAAAVAAADGGLLYVLVKQLPQLFTKDGSVWPHMGSIAGQALISTLFIGIDVASTAVNLARGDLSYVAQSHIITLSAVAAYFWACRTQGWGLQGVWWGVCLFFALRTAQSSGRMAMKLDMLPGAGGGSACSDASDGGGSSSNGTVQLHAQAAATEVESEGSQPPQPRTQAMAAEEPAASAATSAAALPSSAAAAALAAVPAVAAEAA